MSTYIHFPDGETVHIYDVCVTGKTCYKFVENKQTYERERTAVKRALFLHRKKLYKSGKIHRRRRRIVHTRKFMPVIIITPTIVSFWENKTQKHRVIETGKTFKKIENAINNALRYARGFNK